MSRPPWLSPSAWSTWEQCPRRWKFRYVDGLRDEGSIHTVSGRVAHAALDLLMSHPPEDRSTSLRRACLEVALESHAEEIERVGADPDTVRTWATDAVETFPVTEPGTPSSANVLHTEREHRMEVNGVPVLLIVDRIDLVPHKLQPTALAIDYKAGARVKVDEGYKRQMVLSAMAAEEITSLPAPRAELRFVRMGEVREVKTGPTARATVAEDLRRAWLKITEACLEDEFPARPGPLCNWCPYEQDCPDGRRAARQYRERKGIA